MGTMEENLIREVTRVVRDGMEESQNLSTAMERRLTVIECQLNDIKKETDEIRLELKNGDGGSFSNQLRVLGFRVDQHGKIIWWVATGVVGAMGMALWSLIQQRF